MSDFYTESPFLQMLGTNLEEWRDGYVRVSLMIARHHLNRSGVVNGGVLATLLDHAGGFCGLYCSVVGNQRYGVTLSLTTSYVAQSNSGKLIAVGERLRGGSRIYYAKSEVRTDEGVLVAAGSSVHRYRTGSEVQEGVAWRAMQIPKH